MRISDLAILMSEQFIKIGIAIRADLVRRFCRKIRVVAIVVELPNGALMYSEDMFERSPLAPATMPGNSIGGK